MDKYDIFHSQHYNIPNFYWKLLGFWPLDRYKTIKRVIIIVMIISLIIPMSIRFVQEFTKDIDIVFEIAGYLTYLIAVLIKYLSFLFSEDQMMFLFNKIANDWKIIKYEDEIQRLAEYGLDGRLLTISYICLLNGALVFYCLLPLTPMILDEIIPLNETRPRQLPYYVEFFVDEQDYYFEITAHAWLVIGITVQVICGFDTTYACCVQHSCALFTIVESRMGRAAKITTSKAYPNEKERDDAEYSSMRAAVMMHKEAIQFVDEIEKSYNMSFLVVVTLNSAIIVFVAVVAMMSLEKGNVNQLIRYATMYVGCSVHMLYCMLPSQAVIDHSANIQDAVYNCEWYNISPRSAKLLKIVMLRGLRPCKFTGYKLIELNLETFSNVFRKTMSYITVATSMR